MFWSLELASIGELLLLLDTHNNTVLDHHHIPLYLALLTSFFGQWQVSNEQNKHQAECERMRMAGKTNKQRRAFVAHNEMLKTLECLWLLGARRKRGNFRALKLSHWLCQPHTRYLNNKNWKIQIRSRFNVDWSHRDWTIAKVTFLDVVELIRKFFAFVTVEKIRKKSSLILTTLELTIFYVLCVVHESNVERGLRRKLIILWSWSWANAEFSGKKCAEKLSRVVIKTSTGAL